MEAARLQRQWQLEDRDEARNYSRQVLSQLVTDAEAAGFNPLAVLRNGGASNYNAAAGFAPLSRQAPVRQATAGADFGSAVGAGLNRVGDFLADFDPFADQKREQEYRLVESQIAALNASTLSGVPYGKGGYASGDAARTPSAKTSALGSPTAFEQNKAQVTNPWKWFDVNPNAADGSSYEDRYGEFGGSVMGLTTGVADLWQNAKNGYAWLSKRGYVPDYRKLSPPVASVPYSKRNGGGGGW